ncbi:MAG TPA: hypothetical protein VF225_06890 [Gaiellaceae bacterium]|jgi:hypothetical protein
MSSNACSELRIAFSLSNAERRPDARSGGALVTGIALADETRPC